MKKLFFILIAIITILPINIKEKKKKTTFSLNEVTSTVGSEITMKFNVDNNPEFGILAVKFHYDINKLEYISSKINGLENALLKNVESNNKGIIALYAITLDTKKLMNDTGNLVEMKFKIKDEVEEDIKIKVEVTDFGKDENTPIEFDSIDGNIIIKKEIEKVYINNTTALNEKIDDKNNVVWESSDEKIATVDENGNVEFKEAGNVTIKAKDKENNNVIYEKDYQVETKEKANNYNMIIISIIAILLIGIIVFLIKRKK